MDEVLKVVLSTGGTHLAVTGLVNSEKKTCQKLNFSPSLSYSFSFSLPFSPSPLPPSLSYQAMIPQSSLVSMHSQLMLGYSKLEEIRYMYYDL